MSQLIGFIGQGWIGKHYADDFEQRGLKVIRYSLEEPYRQNQDKIKTCEFVFIAVPTPTTPDGFDDSYVRDALKNIGAVRTAIIKSTILPGTTERLQQLFPDIYIFHSPEFLVEKTAAYDAANPTRNIIGLPLDNAAYRERAEQILSFLPKAPFQLVCAAKEAELIKYGANAFLYTKVIFANLLFDLASRLGCDYDKIREMVGADPRIGQSHLKIMDDTGRGAGGHCFIKDFEAFISMYRTVAHNPAGLLALESIRDKNLELLTNSCKNLDLLREVYGKV